ncbi:hypothetical protein EJB05_43578, partial [Eragrostis curvula]
MGSCASRSHSASTTTRADSALALTAKVVDFDGSMAQFAAPLTAHEALLAAAASRFLCCSDELRFDAPTRAMAAHESLQIGQIYFALPLPMLGRPLSGQDMATLAVKATAALGAAPVVDDVSSWNNKSGYDGAAGKQQRRQRQTGQIAPLVVVSGDGSGHAGGELKAWHVYDARKAAVYGGQTVGKTRNGAGYIGGARRLAAGQRLSVIMEGRSESN